MNDSGSSSGSLVRGLLFRFLVSLLCGIVLAEAFVGAAAIYNPYGPSDAEVVVHDIVACGVIGTIAGVVIGAAWCMTEGIRRLRRIPRT